MSKKTEQNSFLEYADLHLHSTLRPFAEFCVNPKSEEADIWFKKPASDKPSGRAKNYTQSDFTSLANGKVKVAFTAMYPIEQGWFDLLEALGITEDNDLEMLSDYFLSTNNRSKHFVIKKLEKFFDNHKDKNAIIEEIIAIIGHLVTSLPVKRIKQIMSNDYNYYNALISELDYLKSQCFNQKNGYIAKIPYSYDDFINYSEESNTLIVIPTIEGGASFVSGNSETIKNGDVDFSTIEKNIRNLKQNYPVFFVTLSHHFYNGFNGHAQSIYGFGRLGIDQMLGKGNIITEHGQRIIRQLLSIDEYAKEPEGKRILIDTKHLSIPARIEYYNFISDYNSRNLHDLIPIISSHSAFSGLNYIENIGLNCDTYSNYEVNIAVQEVEAIYNSKGLLGINFDQNVLSKKPKNAGKKATDEWTDKQWAQLFVDNLLGMVAAVVNKKDTIHSDIWNIFTIGSDFDGFIDPTNSFATADKLPLLKTTLIDVLNQNKQFKQLSFGLSAEEVVNKFMGENVKNFLKTNYPKLQNKLLIS